MTHEAARRQELRAHYLRLRRALPSDQQKSAAEQLVHHLRPLSHTSGAVVGVYAAHGGELSLAPYLQANADHMTLAWPKCRENGHMDFYKATMKDLRPGAFGILEPACGELLAPTALDAILVPGVAFSLDGGRIGMGGGFYDRYLETVRPDIPRVGIAYHWQIVPQLPLLFHDIPMTHLATDQGWHFCSAPPDGEEINR